MNSVGYVWDPGRSTEQLGTAAIAMMTKRPLRLETLNPKVVSHWNATCITTTDGQITNNRPSSPLSYT
ncbi:hypothetical protein FRC14_002545 [Serendipita sp. 396]|nr:hypothetical protein FRC14_002545 [Serendipita sp. 396]